MDIYIPATVRIIGENCFEKCPDIEIYKVTERKISLTSEYENNNQDKMSIEYETVKK